MKPIGYYENGGMRFMADRKEALETAIKQLEKQYGKGTVMKLGQAPALNVEAISTGSISLDSALGIGGVPRGRIVEIYGPESSGKTTDLHTPDFRFQNRTRCMYIPCRKIH